MTNPIRQRKNKKTHPFWCYHCEDRFRLRTYLKKHEMLHTNVRLIKVMKHPFVEESDSENEFDEIDTEKFDLKRVPSFMRRNLPSSLKANFKRRKGNGCLNKIK